MKVLRWLGIAVGIYCCFNGMLTLGMIEGAMLEGVIYVVLGVIFLVLATRKKPEVE